MTHQELQKLLALHRARLQRAKLILDRYYYELEENDTVDYWTNEFIKEKQIIDWLLTQEADDQQ